MKRILLVMMIMLGAMSCDAQAEKSKAISSGSDDSVQGKPKVSWKVNKKYDEQGNLVGYDSTYTWSYSSKGGKMQAVDIDSVMSHFRSQFGMELPSMFGGGFGEAIWDDTLLRNDFASPDLFMRRWRQQQMDMNKMMQRMDSLRNSFLNEHYPGLKATPEKTQKAKSGIL